MFNDETWFFLKPGLDAVLEPETDVMHETQASPTL